MNKNKVKNELLNKLGKIEQIYARPSNSEIIDMVFEEINAGETHDDAGSIWIPANATIILHAKSKKDGHEEIIDDLYWFEENGVHDWSGKCFHDEYEFRIEIKINSNQEIPRTTYLE